MIIEAENLEVGRVGKIFWFIRNSGNCSWELLLWEEQNIDRLACPHLPQSQSSSRGPWTRPSGLFKKGWEEQPFCQIHFANNFCPNAVPAAGSLAPHGKTVCSWVRAGVNLCIQDLISVLSLFSAKERMYSAAKNRMVTHDSDQGGSGINTESRISNRLHHGNRLHHSNQLPSAAVT